MNGINQNAPAKCSKEITINANSEKVWLVLTDIDKWTIWNTEVKNVKLNGKLQPKITTPVWWGK